MTGGLRILLILTFMFIGIYIYSISHRYINAAKKNKIRKSKIDKEEKFRIDRLRLQKIREEKVRQIELRERDIKLQFKWLERMNQKIKQLDTPSQVQNN